MSFHRLLALYERVRPSQPPLVLCTVIRTGGSTYAKPGAQMLIAPEGEYAGLLSGGCLEGDLREHARDVAATGVARIVSYDMRSSDDQLFGLGSGCEGAMDILLIRVSRAEHWKPLEHMKDCAQVGAPCRIGVVVSSGHTTLPRGFTVTGPEDHAAAWQIVAGAPANAVCRLPEGDVELFVTVIPPAPRLLLAGGGPDARPVAQLAHFLGWAVTVADHRSAYLSATHFPPGTTLLETRVDGPAAPLADCSAAIVMSHHLDSDLRYLRALAHSAVPYVGLLGPAARRERLLADLGADAALLKGRLRAPVGLDIGGRSPESIALSIVGEVHATLMGRGGRPFSETAA